MPTEIDTSVQEHKKKDKKSKKLKKVEEEAPVQEENEAEEEVQEEPIKVSYSVCKSALLGSNG